MARDIAETIATGYSAGRAIGNDWASSRFAKADQKLRDELAARSKAEGRPIEDYLDEYQTRMRQLAADNGVTRRSIRDDKGVSLEDSTLNNYRSSLDGAIQRRAGAALAAGDTAGSYTTLGQGRARLGDLEGGQAALRMGDTARVTAGAMKPDGTYDDVGAMRGLTGVAAKYGDAQGADSGQSAFIAKAKQASNMLYGRAAMLLGQNDEGNERAMAYINEGLKMDPRMGSGWQVQYDRANDMFALVSGGEVIDSIPAANASEWLANAAQDPDKLLEAAHAARQQDAAETRNAQRQKDEKFLAAATDLIKTLTPLGVPSAAGKAVVDTALKATQEGWKFTSQVREGPGGSIEQTATLNGKFYIIQYNRQADAETGDPGAAVTIYDQDGNAVPGSQLQGAAEAAAFMQASAAASANSKNAAQVQNLITTAIEQLHALYYGSNEGGGNAPAPEGALRPQANGKYKTPFAETTNYINKIMDSGASSIPADADLDTKLAALLPLVVKAESAGNPGAISPKGAKGLMQVIDATNKDPGYGVQPARDDSPAERVRVGRDYLRAMLERYNGDIPTALAAYNAGPGAVDDWLGGAPSPQQAVAAAPKRGMPNRAARGAEGAIAMNGGGAGAMPAAPAGPTPSSGFLAGQQIRGAVTGFFNRPKFADRPEVKARLERMRAGTPDPNDPVGQFIRGLSGGKAIPTAR